MKFFNIGIDTGGTYTDAVIVNASTREIIATAKSLTTKGQLELGVRRALDEVMKVADGKVDAESIGLISLSTTLATNALVEGTGSSVAAIMIGFSDDMVVRSNLREAIPGALRYQVNGGHDHEGKAVTELDEAALRTVIEETRGQVEAYSVSSNYSVRNQAHERRAKEIIRQETGRPVTMSSDLSDGLNGPARALTATFNVRIVSLIINLVDSVSNAMKEHKIEAPLMIVKGDGSIASAESIIEKPIETILSGPAASVIGANFIANLNDFIISDVGGTTTDVAVVRNGWPALNEKGAMAGNYRTMVKAIDMQTIGLGGDSEVDINHRGEIKLKNNRVVPISLMCQRFPQIISKLETSLSAGMGLSRAIRFIFLPEGADSSNLPPGLSEADLAFLSQIGGTPTSYDELVVRASDRARAERLLDRGLVQVSGVTPSDAAHVLGLQSQWSKEAARLGCLMLGRSHGLIDWREGANESLIVDFAQQIFDVMVGKSSHVLINQLSGEPFDDKNALIKSICYGNQSLKDLNISMAPSIPIVAVGGPAQVFYQAVGQRLSVDTVIPHHAEVANALGAAFGRIKIRSLIEITRSEGGGYQVHEPDQLRVFASSNDALAHASEIANQTARSKALEMGGSDPQIQVDVERVDLPNMDTDMSLIAATVIAECLSTPSLNHS